MLMSKMSDDDKNNDKCKGCFKKTVQNPTLTKGYKLFVIVILIIIITKMLFTLFPKQYIYLNGEMAGNGEFKSASATMIDNENYLLVDAKCGNTQAEIYNWVQNKFTKTKNKIPIEYIPWNHSALKLKNGNILLVVNNKFITKNDNKNFVILYDSHNQTFISYEKTDLSKLYMSVDASSLLLANNGNILLFNKTNNKLLEKITDIYYFNQKNFSLIQSNKIGNFDLFEAKQIGENKILLYGKNGINYIYNLKDNTIKIDAKKEHVNLKLQSLKESKYHIGWEKVIYMKNGDIVFLDPFLHGKKLQNNKLYSKKYQKLININDFKYPREDYATILLPNETILIFGGTCGNSASQYPYNTVEIYKNRED